MAKTIITHDGKFHADDVFAVAALLLVYPDAKVIRTRKADLIQQGEIVVDVGGVHDEASGRFDHHQVGGAGFRESRMPSMPARAGQPGIPYAAFGLVWKKFGEQIGGNSDVARRVEEVLVAPVDANDNGIDLSTPIVDGISTYDISDAMRAFIPTWLEEGLSTDEHFSEAVAFGKRIIEREIKRAEAVVAGRKKVTEAYTEAADKQLVILDGDYSWKDTLAKFPEPLFVVHPQNGTWRLYCVRDNPDLFINRKDLPESWAGLRDEELAKATGVSDAVFCHRNRFMAVARTREGALALARLALNTGNK